MNKKSVKKKKLFFIGGAILALVIAVTFFSTPWKGEIAPDYAPMQGIQLELNSKPSHFMEALCVTVSNNSGRQVQECSPSPELEYFDHGNWYRLKPIPFPHGGTASYLETVDLGEHKTLSAPGFRYGYFLRSGHYRAIIFTPNMAAREFWEAVSVEFDI